MDNPENTKDFYDRWGPFYCLLSKSFWYAGSIQQVIKKTADSLIEIPPHAKILDLGCGEGLATQVLEKRFANSEIAGLDSSEGMLHRYKKKFPHTTALLGDFNLGEVFSFPDKNPVRLNSNPFDLIVSVGSISEYGDFERAIPFVYEILSKRSYFINLGNKPKSLLNRIFEPVWNFKSQGTEEFMSACRNSGFSEVYSPAIPRYIFPASLTKYVVVARK